MIACALSSRNRSSVFFNVFSSISALDSATFALVSASEAFATASLRFCASSAASRAASDAFIKCTFNCSRQRSRSSCNSTSIRPCASRIRFASSAKRSRSRSKADNFAEETDTDASMDASILAARDSTMASCSESLASLVSMDTFSASSFATRMAPLSFTASAASSAICAFLNACSLSIIVFSTACFSREISSKAFRDSSHSRIQRSALCFSRSTVSLASIAVARSFAARSRNSSSFASIVSISFRALRLIRSTSSATTSN